MQVYVACSSKEIERAERAIAALRALGIDITHDWTVPMRKHGPGNDANLDDRVLLPELRNDMVLGVAKAQWVLYLASAENFGQGRFVELGGAFLTGVRIMVAGDVSKEPWARALGTVTYATDDAAIAALGRAHTRLA